MTGSAAERNAATESLIASLSTSVPSAAARKLGPHHRVLMLRVARPPTPDLRRLGDDLAHRGGQLPENMSLTISLLVTPGPLTAEPADDRADGTVDDPGDDFHASATTCARS